ncbi:MAG: IclR family transcriptional regulator [Lautropia sp.]
MQKDTKAASRTYARTPQAAQKDAGPGSTAAGRALAVLKAVSATDGAVSAVDLYSKVGFPKPTIHRMMLLLEELGFLEREPGSKRFITGPALAQLAVETLINSPQRAIRHSILQSLVDEVQETCNITMLSGSEVVYVDRVESNWPLRGHMQPGSRVPMHCSASGKLFLSFMPALKRRRLLNAAPLRKFTEKTVTDPSAIEETLKLIRSSGASLDIEEFMKGLIGLAVPVFDPKGRICATVSMHVPTIRCTPDQALAMAPALKRAAVAVGKTIGVSGKR